MTTHKLSPWHDIAVPLNDFNVRQIASTGGIPSFWGRDHAGNCLFIVELQGDHSRQFRKAAVHIRGVRVDLRSDGAGRERLILRLEYEVDSDLFEALCRALVFELASAPDSSGALAISMDHLKRWRTFMAGRSQLLSPEEVRGLVAELTFFGELLDRGLVPSIVLDAWLGAEGSHQDFIFGNAAIEIKSLSGKERSAVRISSEDQLESSLESLFLRVYRLRVFDGAPEEGRSLNDLVNGLRSRLGKVGLSDIFDEKLAKLGYVPLIDYGVPHFGIAGVRSHYVSDNFPRLTRSMLPQGIFHVSYDIKVEAINAYDCDDDFLFGKL